MAFKHKLSCRLALMRDAVLLLASVGAIPSCEVPSAGSTDPAHQVVQLVVVPESLTLDPSQHMKFAAYGRTPNGDSSAVTVTWNATGGSIASDGTFAADNTPGDFVVRGTSALLGLSASSLVHIRRPRPVASVSVSPGSASTAIGQTVALAATPRDSTGAVLTGRVVTWGSSNTAVATVSGSGLVTGVAVGSATITATSESKSGTAAITVTQTAAPVASVSMSPTTASVTTGQTVQLTATPRDASGNALAGRVVTWGSSNTAAATVNGSGLVSGVAVGSATITATSEGKSGMAAVTVTATSGGGTVLLQENFEDAAFTARGWYDNPGMTLTDSEHVAGSTHALAIHFTPGATTASWGGSARHLFPASNTVYLSYWVKYSANWMGSGTADHPHEFQFMTTEENQYAGPSNSHLTALVEDNYQNGGIPRMSLVDGLNIDQTKIGVDLTTVTELRAAAGCNGNTDGYPTDCYDNGGGIYNNGKIWNAPRPYFLPNPGAGYKGDWHFVEAYFQLNSIPSGKGVADGIVRYWVDGVLAIEHTNVLLRTAAHPTMQFNQFLIGPYIGVGSPVDQTMWVDNLTVATAKP